MIKDFVTAVSSPKKYGELLNNDGFKVTAYVALLVLVCSIGLIIIPAFTIGSRTASVLWEDIPDFRITEQGLQTDNTFDLELQGLRILATNDKQVGEADFGDNIAGVLMDADSVIIRNLDRTEEFEYGEFGEGFVITKNDLARLHPFMYVVWGALYLLLYVTNGISYLLSGLFVGAVASLISVFMGIKMKTGKYIALGLYSISLPYAVSAVLMPFGIIMPDMVLYAVGIIMIFLVYREFRSIAEEAVRD